MAAIPVHGLAWTTNNSRDPTQTLVSFVRHATPTEIPWSTPNETLVKGEPHTNRFTKFLSLAFWNCGEYFNCKNNSITSNIVLSIQI